MGKSKNRFVAALVTVGLMGGAGLATAAPASAAYDGYQVISASTTAECEQARDVIKIARSLTGASKVWGTLCGPGMYNYAGMYTANVFWQN